MRKRERKRDNRREWNKERILVWKKERKKEKKNNLNIKSFTAHTNLKNVEWKKHTHTHKSTNKHRYKQTKESISAEINGTDRFNRWDQTFQ